MFDEMCERTRRRRNGGLKRRDGQRRVAEAVKGGNERNKEEVVINIIHLCYGEGNQWVFKI